MDEKNMIAKVVFDSQAAANAAMNCAHLKRVGETLLDLSYQPYSVRNSSHTITKISFVENKRLWAAANCTM
jgi:hypothetical protein